MLSDYVDTMEGAIRSCGVVATYSLNTVQLSPNTGYVEGEIAFIDGSRLVFFEFLRQGATGLDRVKYRYHFMDADNQLVFRYDNAPHHAELPGFPCHKHLPDGVMDCTAPHCAGILTEIEGRVLRIT